MYLKIIGDHMRAIVYLISDGEKLLNEKLAGVSWELCGGTHVSGTSEIRGFKIISEQGVASGIWRIEAVAGEAFIEHVNTRDFYKEQSCSTLKVKPEEVTTSVENLFEELRLARNENSVLRAQAAVYKALVIANKPILVGNTKQYRVLVEYLDDVDADSLKSTAECLMERVADQAAVVLGSCASEGKVSLVAAFAPGVVDQGIQAGGRKPENLASSLEKSHNLSL